MTGFVCANQGVLIWTGDPDCDAAHGALLQRLVRLGIAFLPLAGSISSRQKGNLGELIAFHVALTTSLTTAERFAQNAIDPLQDISSSGIDLTYVHFDANPANDALYIQEIKTTSGATLAYADNLRADYQKLFSTDLNLTLQSRIQNLANQFELVRNRPDFASRVLRLGGTTAQTSTNVALVPTLVHEKAINPINKMLAIKTAITQFGWNAGGIHPWAIGLTDLDSRLNRLARGMP